MRRCLGKSGCDFEITASSSGGGIIKFLVRQASSKTDSKSEAVSEAESTHRGANAAAAASAGASDVAPGALGAPAASTRDVGRSGCHARP